MIALLYVGGKFLAYCLWCFLGLRYFRSSLGDPYTRSLFLGFLRLIMGLFFGVVIWLAGSFLLSTLGYGLPQNVVTYFSVYVPVRWIEWSIMAVLIVPQLSFRAWLLGSSPVDRYWRLGGIAISCLADIPMIVDFGGVLPTGRFMC